MGERELARVQRLSFKAEPRRATVQTVTDQRHADVREVDADLVGATAVQGAAQRRGAVAFGDAPRAAAMRPTNS